MNLQEIKNRRLQEGKKDYENLHNKNYILKKDDMEEFKV